MQRAQELRVDEFSVQKLRESHETIQRLTSQLQSMQEQMNSLNDSGDFHEEGSNFSGKYSHVPSQPARISSSRSMLSRDKRLQPESWNPPGLQENRFLILVGVLVGAVSRYCHFFYRLFGPLQP